MMTGRLRFRLCVDVISFYGIKKARSTIYRNVPFQEANTIVACLNIVLNQIRLETEGGHFLLE